MGVRLSAVVALLLIAVACGGGSGSGSTFGTLPPSTAALKAIFEAMGASDTKLGHKTTKSASGLLTISGHV